MRDTPDFILAQVCIDAMAVFTEAIARRDEWHGFRKADEKSSQDAKHNYPDDCIAENYPFKVGDKAIYKGKPGTIETIKATSDGSFEYYFAQTKKMVRRP